MSSSRSCWDVVGLSSPPRSDRVLGSQVNRQWWGKLLESQLEWGRRHQIQSSNDRSLCLWISRLGFASLLGAHVRIMQAIDSNSIPPWDENIPGEPAKPLLREEGYRQLNRSRSNMPHQNILVLAVETSRTSPRGRSEPLPISYIHVPTTLPTSQRRHPMYQVITTTLAHPDKFRILHFFP